MSEHCNVNHVQLFENSQLEELQSYAQPNTSTKSDTKQMSLGLDHLNFVFVHLASISRCNDYLLRHHHHAEVATLIL